MNLQLSLKKKWFEEGTNAEKCPDFMEKVLKTKPINETK